MALCYRFRKHPYHDVKGPIAMARVPGAEAVYEVADLFRQRCLVEGVSLLWPDQPVWTDENLDALLEAISNHSNAMWIRSEELIGVAADESEEAIRIVADLVVLFCLYPQLAASTKREYANDVVSPFGLGSPDEATWSLVSSAFEISSPGGGNFWIGEMGVDLTYLMQFSSLYRFSEKDTKDPETLRDIADKTLDFSPSGRVEPRNAILHLLCPQQFVSVTGRDHRKAAVSRLANAAGLDPASDEDMILRDIRNYLRKKYNRDDLDFYDNDVVAEWKPLSRSERRLQYLSSALHDHVDGEQEHDKDGVHHKSLAELVSTTYLNESALREIHDLLTTKKQLIFEGPPGSGKTYVAEKFARWFTGQPLDANTPPNEQVEIIQFHQSYGYEDFVQGIRPETNDDDQLVYRVRDGIFLTLCERAKANPEKPFVLIIDEINRGNISRIFGELLLLLEYRGRSVRLPYGSGENATLTIPENLYIIGTMNTADRSLAQIDYALRRRFYFVRFMPVENGRAEVFGNWLATRDMEQADQLRLLHLFVALNEGIRDHLSTDDLQVGHSYFMTDGIETSVVLNRVWTRAVEPLLNEYLHHHRNRDEILADLTPTSLARTTVDVAPEDGPDLDNRADDSDPDQV